MKGTSPATIFGIGFLLSILLIGSLFLLEARRETGLGQSPPLVTPSPTVTTGTQPSPLFPTSTPTTTSTSKTMSQLETADAAYANGTYQAAMTLYLAYLDEHPTDGAVWLKLANTQRDSGDSAGALTAYNRAQTESPLLGDSYLNAAAVSWQLGSRDEARATLQKGIDRGASREDDLRTTLAVYEALP